jgi:hypothetical protein
MGSIVIKTCTASGRQSCCNKKIGDHSLRGSAVPVKNISSVIFLPARACSIRKALHPLWRRKGLFKHGFKHVFKLELKLELWFNTTLSCKINASPPARAAGAGQGINVFRLTVSLSSIFR